MALPPTGHVLRLDLPRIYELVDGLEDRASPRAYFQDFEATIPGSVKWKHFVHLEGELAKLDISAWRALKARAITLLQRKGRKRGWQECFDCLNGAKAYNYLVLLGCISVRFIPEAKTKTPDLHARLGPRAVLCEVKTINRSDQSIDGGIVEYAISEDFLASSLALSAARPANSMLILKMAMRNGSHMSSSTSTIACTNM